MVKLGKLVEFVTNLNLVALENIDSWAENIRFNASGKSLGNGNIVLFRQEYDAVIYIERFPHQRHPAELLFGQVVAWLMDNDSEREEQNAANPTVDADILDNSTADIEISVPFVEDVEAIPDANGPIEINGQRYRLGDSSINYAKTGRVVTHG